MIRTAVSARAYRAVKATLLPGSVVYPPERNGRGEYLLWLTEAEANRLAALRRRRESYSEAVIRLAKLDEAFDCRADRAQFGAMSQRPLASSAILGRSRGDT